MKQKFKIRPNPQEGESLSGYLIRISEMNCFNFGSVREYLGVDNHYVYPLDILPQRNLVISKLIDLLGVNEKEILKMTFWNLLKKFYSNIIVESNQFRAVISDIFVKNKRRYCVSCLREKHYYKLLWQISEIDMCDIHYTYLQSRCSLCGTEQPFISSTLGKFLCFKCRNDLSKQSEITINDYNTINNQLKLIDDWMFLLNGETSLDEYSYEYSKEKYLIIVSLYISQMMESKFNRKNISFFNSSEITNYLRFINDSEGGRCITLNKLINLSRSFNIDIKRIFNLKVPKAYIDTINNYINKYEERTLGVCLAPWCSNYRSNESLVAINDYKFNRYNNLVCVCNGCFNKYGYNRKTGEWENVDGFIELLWNIVLPSLNLEFSLRAIMSKYKIDYFVLCNAIGYSANYNLLSKELLEKYRVENIPSNIKSYFSYLYDLNGSNRKNAKKCFNWTSCEFYYYLNTKEVQEYLLFEKKMFLRKFSDHNVKKKSELKKELKDLLKYYLDSDININIKNIEMNLNCSNSTIYRKELGKIIRDAIEKQTKIRKVLKNEYIKSKVNEYFQKIDLTNKLLTCKQVHKDLELSKAGLGQEKREVIKLISSEVKAYNSKVIDNRTKKLIEQVNKTVEELSILGENVTYEKIAYQLGISKSTLVRNSALKESISEAIKKYYI